MKNAPYDVVVVGGGNAALCAALSATERGARVLMLERAPEEKRGGNSAFAGGGMRIVYSGVEDIKKYIDLSEHEIANTDFGEYTREQYLDTLGRVTQYHCDPDLTENFVNESADTVLWIRKQGVRFVPHYGRSAFQHEGRFKFFGGAVVEVSGGGRGLVEMEYKAAAKKGIEVRYNSQATTLLRGLSGVDGVRVLANGREDEIRAKAVVLAAGGFSVNREGRAKYLGPGWDVANARGSRFNTGDGLRMALEIGAQPYGQWSGCHSVAWERHAPPFGELEHGQNQWYRYGYPFSIMVNSEGQRFVDEGSDFRNLTYATMGRIVLAQPGSYAWQVFDSQMFHLLHDEYRARTATKVRADTLEDLVTKMQDVHPQQFLETVREYNAAIKRDVPFDPNVKDGRCAVGLAVKRSNWANPIEKPPFEAYAIGCGVTFTFGGIKIDTTSRVLDITDSPIPGLYCAGEMVGGLFYFNYPGSTGLVSGSVYGRIAGREAAAHSKAKVKAKGAAKANSRSKVRATAKSKGKRKR